MQVHGSGALIRWLFANQLVDEITLAVHPEGGNDPDLPAHRAPEVRKRQRDLEATPPRTAAAILRT
jgi:hypothetical protein